MAKNEPRGLDLFRKWNFLFFFKLIQKINPDLARRFLYMGIADHSIYEEPYENPILNTIMFSKMFPNPIGIAAGFDSSFRYNDILMDLGFGFEEFGTITENPSAIGTKVDFLKPQKGLSVDAREFENMGVVASQKALIARRHLPHLVGVNIGSNFEFSDKSFDISTGFVQIERELVSVVQKTAPYCDYLVLNLTHPTLPISSLVVNLSLLKSVLNKIRQTILRVAPISKPPLLVKIPLDVTPANIPLLIDVLLEAEVEGIIIGGYLNLDKGNKNRIGKKSLAFLAGSPLNDASTEVIEQFYSI